MTTPIPSVPTADSLIALLGLESEDPRVQASLAQLARGMQPELEPDDEQSLFDWVTVNELGLEFGFMDEAFLRALERSQRRNGPLILFQVFFYGDTPKMQAYPFPLPFGLVLSDDRAAVRRKLAQYEHLRRSYVRDFWALPDFNFAIKYAAHGGGIEIVYCYLPYTPWPPNPDEAAFVAQFPLSRLTKLFGLRWSSEELRTALAPLGYDAALPDVRSTHMADFSEEHGLSFTFVPAQSVPSADQSAPMTYVLGGVTFYSFREEESRMWEGELPLGLQFSDTPKALRDEVGKAPAESGGDDFSETSIWHFPEYTLNVLCSTLENRLLKISLYAPGFWSSTGSARS